MPNDSVQGESAPVATRSRRPFRIHWSTATITGVFYLSVFVLAGVNGTLVDLERIADLVVLVFKMIMFTGVVSWIVYRVAFRSALAGNITWIINQQVLIRTLDGKALTNEKGQPLPDAPTVEDLLIDDPSEVEQAA